jgi:hypothetical protein
MKFKIGDKVMISPNARHWTADILRKSYSKTVFTVSYINMPTTNTSIIQCRTGSEILHIYAETLCRAPEILIKGEQ